MKSHKDLEVWKQAVSLAGLVYEVTKGFPADERFGLTTQMRRAAVSIASNIAEGAARHSDKEFVRFLHIASGSASELDTQLEIAELAGIARREDIAPLCSTRADIENDLRTHPFHPEIANPFHLTRSGTPLEGHLSLVTDHRLPPS